MALPKSGPEESNTKNRDNAIRSCCSSEERASKLLRLAFNGIIENEMSDLTMRQMAIFMTISQEATTTPSDLSKELGISLSSISRSIDALVTKGIIKKDRNGKNVNVQITPRGRAVIGRAIASINTMV